MTRHQPYIQRSMNTHPRISPMHETALGHRYCSPRMATIYINGKEVETSVKQIRSEINKLVNNQHLATTEVKIW